MPRVPNQRSDVARFLQQAAMEDRFGVTEVVTGLSAEASLGMAGIHRKVFRFEAMPIVMADNAGVIAWGSRKLFTFPKATILVLGASLQAATGKTSAGILAAFRATFGLGTAAADNTNTLSANEQNIIPTTTMAAAAAGVGVAQAFNAAAIAPLDGNTTAPSVYLNALINDADHDLTATPGNLLLTGQLVLMYADLGSSKP